MPSKKPTLSKKDKCERCKRAKALYRVTELLQTKLNRKGAKPYQACPGCARKAQNLGGKMIERL